MWLSVWGFWEEKELFIFKLCEIYHLRWTLPKIIKICTVEMDLQTTECFEHILLNNSKGSETSSGNLLVPLIIYNNMSYKL